MDYVMKKLIVVFFSIFMMTYCINIPVGFSQSQQNQYAIDQQAFIDRFSKSFGAKANVTIGGATQDEQNIILTDIHISGDILTPDTKFKKITFQNVTALPHGGFTISRVLIDSLSYRYEKSFLVVDSIRLINTTLPANEGIYNQNVGFTYDKGTFKSIRLLDEQAKLLGSLHDGTIALTRSIKQNPVKFKIQIGRIIVEVKNFPAGTNRTDFINMGYSRASGKLSLAGAYGGNNSLMQLDQFTLILENGGKLDAILKMDGISVDSLLTLLTLQRDNDHGKIDKSRMALGMLGQIQRYNFYGGSFKYQDNGLTNKIIAAQAKREKKTHEDIRGEWTNTLPGWLSFSKNTSFFNPAKNEIGIFINNPKTLRLTSQPIGRTSLVMLALTGKINPESLIKQLKLSIKANE